MSCVNDLRSQYLHQINIIKWIFSIYRPGQQPQLVQTIQQNPQIVQIQPQQNQQSQPVQMQQVTVQPQVQPQQRKGLTLSVKFHF